MTRKASVSAQDVARAAGVSRAAVSRTFTPGASVSEATRSRVRAAADALGYHVNHLARGLTRDESGIVALIVAELDTPYRSRLASTLTDRLQAAGKIAMIINTDRSDASVEAALRKAIGYRTDAAIMLSGMPDRALADLCLRNGLRLVLINRDEDRPGSLRIRLNDEEAGAVAARALVRAGCERPALATSAAGTTSLAGRERGFLTELQRLGLPPIRAARGPTGYETGLALGTELLTRAEQPDGIFCTTDLLAFGVMDAARNRFGLRVPRDLCVIGFDDVPQAGWEAYDLTSFSQPVDEIAEACAAWLSDPARPDEMASVTLHAPLIWRSTVGRPDSDARRPDLALADAE